MSLVSLSPDVYLPNSFECPSVHFDVFVFCVEILLDSLFLDKNQSITIILPLKHDSL